jgi:N-acetylglucosaminyldiphosphoundecaprenol N-acetyl-beta-D-mannosaminyltransferase
MTRALRTLEFCGLPLLTGGMDEVADWIARRAESPSSPTTIAAHLNVFNYYLLQKRGDAIGAVRQHYQCLFDGIGMKLGALVAGHGLLPDLNGTDLFLPVMRRIAETGSPVFFLGATPSVLTLAIEQVRRRFPGVRIAGSHDGYFTEADWPRVAATVRGSRARLLLVSMGSSMQTGFLVRHRDDFGVSLVWNVGGLFDFVSGAKPRAPRWMRGARLEWLYRLAREPRRMWIRTCVAVPWFYYRVLRDSFFDRHTPHASAFQRPGTES